MPVHCPYQGQAGREMPAGFRNRLLHGRLKRRVKPARRFDAPFGSAMREAVAEARRHFATGLPLVGTVNRQLSLALDLFNRGGIAILDRIAAERYDVLKARPRISKVARVRILMGSLARWAFRAA